MENLTPRHHADHARAGVVIAHPRADEMMPVKVSDLLADLMHLADLEGFSFNEALDNARDHYSHEREGDD